MGGMPDGSSGLVKKRNWNLVRREVKKFGIDIERGVGEAIIDGDDRLLLDLIEFLIDFEKGGGPSLIMQSVLSGS